MRARQFLVIGALGLPFVALLVPRTGGREQVLGVRLRLEEIRARMRLRTIDNRIRERMWVDSQRARLRAEASGARRVGAAHVDPRVVSALRLRKLFGTTGTGRIEVMEAELPVASENQSLFAVALLPTAEDPGCHVYLARQRDPLGSSRVSSPGDPARANGASVRLGDLAPCGLFRVFGKASGATIADLQRASWAPALSGVAIGRTDARDSLWGRTPLTRNLPGILHRADGIVSCTNGDANGCLRALWPSAPDSPPGRGFTSDYAIYSRGSRRQTFAWTRSFLLQDLERAIGREAFAIAWRDSVGIVRASERRLGVPFTVFLSQWARRAFGRYPIGPDLTSEHVVGALLIWLLYPLTIALAVARRRLGAVRETSSVA